LALYASFNLITYITILNLANYTLIIYKSRNRVACLANAIRGAWNATTNIAKYHTTWVWVSCWALVAYIRCVARVTRLSSVTFNTLTIVHLIVLEAAGYRTIIGRNTINTVSYIARDTFISILSAAWRTCWTNSVRLAGLTVRNLA